MPDKLPDHIVKKALDVCGHTKGCTNCPLGNDDVDNCQLLLTEGAIDIINRLEAENERLKTEKDNLIKTYSKCQVANIKEFAGRLEEAFSKAESQIPNSEIIKQTVQVCRNAIGLVLKEMVYGKSLNDCTGCEYINKDSGYCYECYNCSKKYVKGDANERP